MILFDGCSWTMGAELEEPNHDRWSTLVSDHFQTDHVNLGEGGKSNDGILRTTIEYCENHKVDFAVIQLTKNNRREILNNVSYKRLNPTQTDSAVVSYYKYLNTQEDDTANYYKNKFLLEHYLTVNKIPYYFVRITHRYPTISSIKPSSWQMMSDSSPVHCLYDVLGGVNSPYLNYRKKENRHTHPNAKGHRRIADYILKNLKGVFL